jgi:hypothetical protein
MCWVRRSPSKNGSSTGAMENRVSRVAGSNTRPEIANLLARCVLVGFVG